MSIAYDNMRTDNTQRLVEQYNFVGEVTHWRKLKDRKVAAKILLGREKIQNLLNRAVTR